ncbi:MAG: tetratricopeptide repeat protein [Pyrinomonadaceae bacterium]
MNERANPLIALTIIIAGFAVVFALNGFIPERRPTLPDGLADSDLHVTGSRLRGFAFGSDGLIADWYYMRALQYVGDKILNYEGMSNIDDMRAMNPRLLHPLLENATDLDPHFLAAYTYGGIVLPAIDAEKAIAFANKGIMNNPDKWRLYQNLAYIYWRLGEYENAAQTFERGAAVKDASGVMSLMAAVMRSKGGSRETARSIYSEMLATSPDWQVTLTADRRLKELTSLDERDAADKVLSDVRERTGRCPAAIREILPQLTPIVLPAGHRFRIDAGGNLVDPTGAPYLLDRETCKIKLDRENTQIPL